MKRIYLFILMLTMSVAGYAQNGLTRITFSSGTMTVIDPGGNKTVVAAAQTFYRQDTIRRYFRIDGVGGGITISNDAFKNYRVNNVSYATMDGLGAALVSNGVSTSPSGGGAGDASASNQVIGNTQLTQINAKTPALGQTTMSGSQPVVIASNQTGIPVTGTFFQPTQPVSLTTVPLATGAATATNQATQITAEQAIQASAASIDTKTPTVGQKASSASSPVVLASDQSAISVNIASTIRPLNSRTSTAVTVGTSSTTLTAANALGYRVLIQNNGANDVWISIGGVAVLAPPSILITAGGSYLTAENYPEIQAITAISTSSQPISVIIF